MTHAFSDWEFLAFAALIAAVIILLVRASSHVRGLRRDYPFVKELPLGMFAFRPSATRRLLSRGGMQVAAGTRGVAVAEMTTPSRFSGWCIVPWNDVEVHRSIVPMHIEMVIGKNGQLSIELDHATATQMRIRAGAAWPDHDNELGLEDRFLHVN